MDSTINVDSSPNVVVYPKAQRVVCNGERKYSDLGKHMEEIKNKKRRLNVRKKKKMTTYRFEKLRAVTIVIKLTPLNFGTGNGMFPGERDKFWHR